MSAERKEYVAQGEESAQDLNNQKTNDYAKNLGTEVIESITPETEQQFLHKKQCHLETNEATIKEVADGVENDMPLSKTPCHHNTSENTQICDMDYASLDKTSANIINENYTDNMGALFDRTATDIYLDGLETPIGPVRVKAEFILPKSPQHERSEGTDCLNKECNAMSSKILQAPPPPSPPTFSSNSNLDFVTDGITTPRISLTAMNRIRVKAEFSVPSSQPVNDNCVNDSVIVKTEIPESGEVSPNESEENSENEPIPEGFFDDLLHDKLQERIEEAQNYDLEEKFSVRLKEYRRLRKQERSLEEKSKTRSKSRKKQKKSKKKSKKRSRSRSFSPCLQGQERNCNELSHVLDHDSKRLRRELPSISKNLHTDGSASENCVRSTPRLEIKSEFSANKCEDIDKGMQICEAPNEIVDLATPTQKKERAMKRATALLNYLKTHGREDFKIFSSFPFVSTVRKLPTSHSYVKQQIYENRSPLHIVNNVNYKFNSHKTLFNMEEWGLAALPPAAAKLAKLVGTDAQFIHDKMKTIRIPVKLKQVKQESKNDAVYRYEEDLIETTSSLFSNAMTQTDDGAESHMAPKAKGYEVGVQVECTSYSIGCQTLETQSPAEDEMPILKLIHDLNENQLMAMHAFAELIKKPNSNVNAMGMYKMQMQLLEIYKMSQIPSAIITAPNPIVNNYTTMTSVHREQAEINIQSLEGADEKQFSVNNPRAQSVPYVQRSVQYDGVQSSFDSRHSQHSNSGTLPNVYQSQWSHSKSSGNMPMRERENAAHSHNWPSTRTKRYGRGALRRC